MAGRGAASVAEWPPPPCRPAEKFRNCRPLYDNLFTEGRRFRGGTDGETTPGRSPGRADEQGPALLHLRLFVSPDDGASLRTARCLRTWLMGQDPGRCRFELVDVSRDAAAAAADGVTRTPTLVRIGDPLRVLEEEVTDVEMLERWLDGHP